MPCSIRRSSWSTGTRLPRRIPCVSAPPRTTVPTPDWRSPVTRTSRGEPARLDHAVTCSCAGECPGGLERESAVAVGDHLVALLTVGPAAGDVRHEHARLARDVRADVPRPGERVNVPSARVLTCAPIHVRHHRSPRSRNTAVAHRLEKSLIQSTCCSIETTMLLSTDGLPGPVTMNMFGKPATARPR